MSHLTDWLATLRPAELAEVLLARGDVLAAPAPRTVAELADRLGHPSSVAAAVFRLPLPAVQIAEAVQALGDGRPLRALASALGRGVGDEELLRTVRTLRRHALVWTEEATLRTAGLGHVWTHPIGLGRPVAELLAQRRIAELKQIAFNLGLEPAHHKQHLIDDIADWLTDEDAVRQLIEDAPCQVRELLREAAWRGPVVESPERAALDPSEDPMRWATSRGLVAGGQWGPRQIPAEVALALRGPGYRFPFDPQPPAVSYAPTPGDAVEHESAAAAGTALSHVAGLLRHCARTPLTLLKSGGVGAREMSRLAAATGVPEQQIRFWLELCHAARLVAVTTLRQAADGHSPRHSAARSRTDAGSSGAPRHGSSGLAPTLAYDTWLASDPAERLAVLLDGWLRLPVASLHDSGADRAARAALLWPATGGLAPDLRRSLLLAAASLPEGSAADPRHVSELAAWRQPMLFHAMEEGPLLSLALWREAALLGVVGHDAVTELGRALLSGDAEQLKGVAHSLLPASETVARFQADLSAVVTGTPSVELADLLDGAADRESHDAAVTWRFSYQSVRRGYDAGATSDQLLAALRACAVDGTLPQPLEYLVRDVARRHGTIRVRELGCCLRVSDPAVLDEILATSSLAPLGLSRLAPTVLGSAVSAAETLQALRVAGHAPIEEDAQAAPIAEPAGEHRAEAGRCRQPSRAELLPGGSELPGGAVPGPARSDQQSRPSGDLTAVASELLAAGAGTVRELSGKAPEGLEAAAKLTTHEQWLLGDAIDKGAPVRISYTNARGADTIRVIEEAVLEGPLLHAWCTLRQDDRVFALARISSVSPA